MFTSKMTFPHVFSQIQRQIVQLDNKKNLTKVPNEKYIRDPSKKGGLKTLPYYPNKICCQASDYYNIEGRYSRKIIIVVHGDFERHRKWI